MGLKRSTSTNIENAAREAVKIIASATETAAKTIASAASEATKVVATNAEAAAKVVATVNGGDHDLLVELKTDMKMVKETLQIISEKEDTHLTQTDFAKHELEEKVRYEKLITIEQFIPVRNIVYGMVGLILTSVFGGLMYLLIK